MRRRILAIMRKEVWHILRDWQTLTLIIVLPVFMMFLYGYALDVNIREVKVLVEDPLPSAESGAMIRSIDQSTLFRVVGVIRSAGNPVELFRQYPIRALFRFPTDFAANLKRPGGTSVQLVIDGSDQNLGTILRNSAEPFLNKAALALLNIPIPSPVVVHQTILYNPEQKSALFFVPGLMGLILIMVSALLTALAITREKESGTLENLLVSPLRPAEVLLGKIGPYIVLAALDTALILVVGRVLFGVRVAGSLWVLGLACTIYIIASLAIGLLVSTVVKKQEHAMMIVMPATMMPSLLLSGFIFPISSMPVWLQVVTCAVPARYFLVIIRGVILKGVGVVELWQPFVVLTAIGLFLMVVSVKKFRTHL